MTVLGSETENLTLVWNIEKDIEVANFSIKDICNYINGPSSKAGYFLLND